MKVFPNPTASDATIPFAVEKKAAGGLLKVAVYDAAGRLIRGLLESAAAVPGEYRLLWDSRDDRGVEAAAGDYFVQIQIGDKIDGQAIRLTR